jgi:hypothetical protein
VNTLPNANDYLSDIYDVLREIRDILTDVRDDNSTIDVRVVEPVIVKEKRM